MEKAYIFGVTRYGYPICEFTVFWCVRSGSWDEGGGRELGNTGEDRSGEPTVQAARPARLPDIGLGTYDGLPFM
ncbi:hypothetical protein OROGR_012265 [Orobanche gracilis]